MHFPFRYLRFSARTRAGYRAFFSFTTLRAGFTFISSAFGTLGVTTGTLSPPQTCLPFVTVTFSLESHRAYSLVPLSVWCYGSTISGRHLRCTYRHRLRTFWFVVRGLHCTAFLPTVTAVGHFGPLYTCLAASLPRTDLLPAHMPHCDHIRFTSACCRDRSVLRTWTSPHPAASGLLHSRTAVAFALPVLRYSTAISHLPLLAFLLPFFCIRLLSLRSDTCSSPLFFPSFACGYTFIPRFVCARTISFTFHCTRALRCLRAHRMGLAARRCDSLPFTAVDLVAPTPHLVISARCDSYGHSPADVFVLPRLFALLPFTHTLSAHVGVTLEKFSDWVS